MPKKLKLNLNDLKVKSFVTALNEEEKRKMKGGTGETDGDDCDTSTCRTCASICTCVTCLQTCASCPTACLPPPGGVLC